MENAISLILICLRKKILVWDETLEDGNLLKSFLTQEFTSPTLSSLVILSNGVVRSNEKKESLCNKIISLFESGRLSSEQILYSRRFQLELLERLCWN